VPRYLQLAVRTASCTSVQWTEFWFVGKVSEIISRYCATLSAIGCTYCKLHICTMDRILVRWKSFRNNLEILCHPICNWLYVLQVAHMYKKTQMKTKQNDQPLIISSFDKVNYTKKIHFFLENLST